MAATKPQIRGDLVVAEVGDELIVFDPTTEAFHHLNPSASLVLGLCDGTATMKETAADVAAVSGRDPAEVEREVRGLVRHLRKQDLLEPTRRNEPAHDGHEHAHEHDHEHDGRELVRIQVPKSE
jgi:hypothetical protein